MSLKKLNENTLPFNEKILNGEKIRLFNEDVDSGELMWHRDREDRIVEIIDGKNWMIQMDDEIPVVMEVGKKYFIPKGVYHRTIKGEGNLLIKITEN
jgi:hypothetical protein